MPDTSSVEKRSFDNARFTYFVDGLGACGQTNVASDFIVALNTHQWDGGSHCFEAITITYNGKTATASIADECQECPENALDFSQGLFDYFASEDAGTIYGSWSYASDTAATSSSSVWTPTTTSTSSTWVAPTTSSTPTPTPTPTPTTSSTWSSSSSWSSSTWSSSSSSSSSSFSSSSSYSSSSVVSSSSAAPSSSTTDAAAVATGVVASGNIYSANMALVQLGMFLEDVVAASS
ncbi:uncharacterized protein STEHIDRAFT_154254 [Stereum hirsutum FP-91666 SS1]|uniref:uncharacterized protein n=1 Tax=Stereum hirsutum (strain FP-91666) TaxID=721885 RepID=UPI000440E56C|nr:uncharacterized protein STEHIDRAFT_154254 [Stereum hirsutum FP-91666 SS1]EIM90428.1 hypothetical protein STEHIDRAFT_154254 [Stereum hirsutum FP-91666 SS1]